MNTLEAKAKRHSELLHEIGLGYIMSLPTEIQDALKVLGKGPIDEKIKFLELILQYKKGGR